MGSLTKVFLRTVLPLSKDKVGQSALLKQGRTITSKFFSIRYVSSSYKAAVLTEIGQPLTIKELPRKALKKGEMRIRVYCCGINSIDQMTVSGEMDPPPKLPVVPGYEVCGELLEVGENVEGAEPMAPGQRVIGMHPNYQGGFAEEIIISAKDVWPVNNSLSFEIGATLVNSYATALIALSRRAEVKKGDTVLVTGAGGRLGLAAVDLAANAFRCKVIACCATEEKATAVRERGAFATVIDGKQDLVAEVKRINDGMGVKIIIDPVGGDVFKKAIQCLEDEGKIVVTGFASKRIPQIGADELLENSYSVVGVSLDQYRKKRFEVYRQAITEVIEMADENLIKPFKAKHYSLENVNEALERLKRPGTIGKYVIDIKP